MGSLARLPPASAGNLRPASRVQFECKLTGSTMEEMR